MTKKTKNTTATETANEPTGFFQVNSSETFVPVIPQFKGVCPNC